MISPSKLLRSQAGSTIVVVAIGLIALGAIFYSYANWATSTQKGKKNIDTKATVRSLMDQIANSIDNDQAFFNTASNNARLNCFVSGGSCPMGATGALNIYLGGPVGPNSVLSSTNPSSGFDMNGNICTGFDATLGNDQCPIRFEVTGELSCGSSCTATVDAVQRVSIEPRLQVNIKLRFKPRTPSAFTSMNEEKVYNVLFDRGKNKGVTKSYCAAIGGVYNSSSRFCTLNTQGDCPSGSYMVGLDGSGGRVCQQRLAAGVNVDVACSPGAAFVGTLTTGKFTCGKY